MAPSYFLSLGSKVTRKHCISGEGRQGFVATRPNFYQGRHARQPPDEVFANGDDVVLLWFPLGERREVIIMRPLARARRAVRDATSLLRISRSRYLYASPRTTNVANFVALKLRQ